MAEEKHTRRGRQNMSQKKAQAEYLFLHTDLTAVAIAQIVNVTEKTLSAWVNANNKAWKIARTAKAITPERLIAAYYSQLNELNEMINKREEGERFPSSTEADTISKLVNQIEKLKKKHNLSSYISAIDEFTKFLNRKDANLVKQLAPFCIDFMREKANVLVNA